MIGVMGHKIVFVFFHFHIPVKVPTCEAVFVNVLNLKFRLIIFLWNFTIKYIVF